MIPTTAITISNSVKVKPELLILRCRVDIVWFFVKFIGLMYSEELQCPSQNRTCGFPTSGSSV